tara:strand:- start:80 stop:547 length:468 start_codon:yes stop_codon:yes gene_type:complete
MKLYAKTTSERANKGQGGNKKLEIILTADNPERREEYKIWYQIDEKGTHLAIYDVQRGENILAKPKSRQKDCGIEHTKPIDTIVCKQKDEKCWCSETELSIPHYSDDHTKGKQQKGEKCPHCDIALKAKMHDIDGTNLVESITCPECGYGTPAML